MEPTGRDGRGRAFPRRGFLGATMAGAIGLPAPALLAGTGAGEAGAPGEEALAAEIAKLTYLTPSERFSRFEREKPPISRLPDEKLREVGLHPDTWRLEVVPDPESDARVERPLGRQEGTALDWAGLLKLAGTRAVRFLHVLSCTNMDEPLGMGLWEGVPLRDVVWMARPASNVRRVVYCGYHNDDAKQRFQASLSIDRVLEDGPGELPVILCHKLNGQPLPPAYGGPVRLIVPGMYGNRSVKWLQRVVLTNSFQASDTYAGWNNDVESALKTFARLIRPPATAKSGRPMPLVGLAQVGVSGLGGVQFSLAAEEAAPAPDDPYLERLEWRDARILPPPEDWGGGLPGGRLPPGTLQIDAATGRPRAWPLPCTIVHWAALPAAPPPGKYRLRCRALDGKGIAQPLPRPLPRSGNNAIQEVRVTVEPA